MKAGKAEHDALIADLQADLVAAGNNASEQSAINDKIAAENQRYTDAHRNDTQQRIALGHQEVEEATQNADRLKSLALQLEAAENEGAALHGRTTSRQIAANQSLTQEYVNLARSQVSAAQSALLYAQVAGQDTDAIDKLVEKLKQAQIALQGALNTKAEADSKTPVSEASQEYRRRQPK